MIHHLFNLFLAALTAIALIACGGGGDSKTNVAPVEPHFQLAAEDLASLESVGCAVTETDFVECKELSKLSVTPVAEENVLLQLTERKEAISRRKEVLSSVLKTLEDREKTEALGGFAKISILSLQSSLNMNISTGITDIVKIEIQIQLEQNFQAVTGYVCLAAYGQGSAAISLSQFGTIPESDSEVEVLPLNSNAPTDFQSAMKLKKNGELTWLATDQKIENKKNFSLLIRTTGEFIATVASTTPFSASCLKQRIGLQGLTVLSDRPSLKDKLVKCHVEHSYPSVQDSSISKTIGHNHDFTFRPTKEEQVVDFGEWLIAATGLPQPTFLPSLNHSIRLESRPPGQMAFVIYDMKNKSILSEILTSNSNLTWKIEFKVKEINSVMIDCNEVSTWSSTELPNPE